MDNSIDGLHSNWRALATTHLNLKRFVRAGDNDAGIYGNVSTQEKYQIARVTSNEIKQFYQEVINTPPKKQCKVTNNNHKPAAVKNLQPFDEQKFFRFAMDNNVNALQTMQISPDNVNTCDAYGWTALMMAACEGAVAVVNWLCQIGADKSIADKSGCRAIDLAKKKGHQRIVCILENAKELTKIIKEQGSCDLVEPFFCDVCQRNFTETSKRAHETSTVHQFNMKSSLPVNKLLKFNISAGNRGLQLMIKQGWDREHGLGPTQNGRLYPIKTVLRKQRTGLGIEQKPAKVTHFGPYDLRATQRNVPPIERKRTRNDMKREKVREWKLNRRLQTELS